MLFVDAFTELLSRLLSVDATRRFDSAADVLAHPWVTDGADAVPPAAGGAGGAGGDADVPM